MGIKCPKCQYENPSDTVFCGKCGTQFESPEDITASPTETLEAPKEELTTGSIFAGRYQIIEELGKGGMGKVYKVLDKDINEKVALKLLKPEIATDAKTIERFRNELKLARKVSHKNVCRMYDLGKDKGTHYITMEFVPGEDLKSSISRMGPITVGKTIAVAKQICEGLAEAHGLGVVHRDLKPQNIMVDQEGNARIMDFGIARSVRGKGITGASVMIGTPEYMSPEQVEGKETDQRSDIYSLGVILYEMVTGRVPFEGDTPFTIGVKHKSELPQNPKELNAQLPDDLNRVILRCLEKDKDSRYQSAGEVRSELERIEKGLPTTEKFVPKRRPVTSREITVTFGLRKLLIPALAVIILAVITVIVLIFLPRKALIEHSVAVISFENQTGERSYDYLQKAIPNLLITSLEQSRNIRVVTWERMHDLLEQMGKEEVEIIDPDLGFELCRRNGIEALVLGSFVKAGEMFATDVKVLDATTKNLLKSTSSRGKGVDSILERQIDELSREVSRGIGLPVRRVEEAKMRIADVTTTSMEAYNFFLKGKEAFNKFYYEEAKKHLEKAVELDPQFAGAYLFLSYVQGELQSRDAQEEALKKAKEHSGKATEKERLFIEAEYTSIVEGDSEKRLHLLKELVEKYPKEKEAHLVLGLVYQNRDLFEEALEEYNKALELDPNWGYLLNSLAYTYSDMGNYEKAIEYFQKYVAVSPGDANPIDSLAEQYFRMGRLNEAIENYKKVLDIKPDFGVGCRVAYMYALKENYAESMKWVEQFISSVLSPGLKAEGFLWKGIYYFLLGRKESAFSSLLKAEKLAEEARDWPRKTTLDYIRGWWYFELGELELSKEYFQKAWDPILLAYPKSKGFQSAYEFCLGMVETKKGEIDSARSRVDKIKSLLPELTPAARKTRTFQHDWLQAEILMAQGSSRKAIEILEKIVPQAIPNMHTDNIGPYNMPFIRDVLARAYQQNGQLDKVISEYERKITFDPDSKDRHLIHPKYHYLLAKLYQEKGLSTKAIEQYEAFLDLWKDADPILPELEDAKKSLTALKRE